MRKKQPARTPPSHPFQRLNPEAVLRVVEEALELRCTNLCRPLASYINRVYELEGEDGSGLIAKFYRPGRWSRTALQDEHDFLLELAEREIPVIPPMLQRDGQSLGEHDGMCFAIFPKCGGRSFDEYNEEQWLEIGRLLGRTHAVGSLRRAEARITMSPQAMTRSQADQLLKSGLMPKELAAEFNHLVDSLISQTAPLFAETELIRIHGDCHFANLIHRPDESFFLIDFDDMAMGPPVQDLWMLLPGGPEEAALEIDLFLEGYETFRDFDRRSLGLIEPLRAMRFIHYMAWGACQVTEDGESRAIPDFGSREYWQRELNDLADQLERIRHPSWLSGNH